jgi:hypothetical protein
MSTLLAEASHTPGPWNRAMQGDTIEISISATPFGRKVIAEVQTGFDEPFESQQHANARLIAAAPELLHALRKFVEWQDEMKNAVPRIYIDRAKEAIAKAEGRS